MNTPKEEIQESRRFWLKVSCRGNASGNFWCSATVKGLDIYEGGATPREAREAFRRRTGLRDEEIMWLPIQHYQGTATEKVKKSLIRPQKVRLDENPQG